MVHRNPGVVHLRRPELAHKVHSTMGRFLRYNGSNVAARRESMTAIVCDICKKPVAGARRGDNYMTVLDKDVCEACADDLLGATKVQMKTRRPYTFKDYNDTLVRNLNSMTR
jgi:hypothetical protein